MEVSFEKANEYASKFEPFREFYQENDNLDIVSLQEEDHGTLAHAVQYNIPSGRGALDGSCACKGCT